MSRAEFLRQQIQRVDGTAPNPLVSKHVKMAISPFVFFRGSAQLFYADLAAGRLALPHPLLDTPLTCIIGDCHTSNFGFLTEEGSHGDRVIFAPNDFDDACVGYGGWDMLRFLVSVALVADHCEGAVTGKYCDDDIKTGREAVDSVQTTAAMQAFLHSYRDTCRELAQNPENIHTAVDVIPPDTRLRKYYDKACRRAAGGEDFTIKSALAKSVEMGHDSLRFRRKSEKFARLANHLYEALEWAFAPYMDDTVIDIVERLNAGTGSVNMPRYYFLVGPPRPHNEEAFARCHIVEVKAQRQAAPLYYYQALHPVNRLNPAHLTARCQKRMQRRADLLLDEVAWQDHHWLIRSRHHAKVGLDPGDVATGKKNQAGGFVDFAAHCGRALGLAHARGDRRSTLFEQTMTQRIDDACNELIESAMSYSDQVIQDHRWLLDELSRANS